MIIILIQILSLFEISCEIFGLEIKNACILNYISIQLYKILGNIARND